MAECEVRLQDNLDIHRNEERTMKPVRQVVLCLATLAASLGAQSKRPMTFMDIMELKNVGGAPVPPAGGPEASTVAPWDHPNAKPARTGSMPDTAKGDRHEMRSH